MTVVVLALTGDPDTLERRDRPDFTDWLGRRDRPGDAVPADGLTPPPLRTATTAPEGEENGAEKDRAPGDTPGDAPGPPRCLPGACLDTAREDLRARGFAPGLPPGAEAEAVPNTPPGGRLPSAPAALALGRLAACAVLAAVASRLRRLFCAALALACLPTLFIFL